MAEKLNHIRLAWAGGVHWFEIEAPEPPEAYESEWEERLARYRGADAHLRAPLYDHAGAVLKRLISGMFGHADITETIRCGLIGGGELETTKATGEWNAAGALVAEHVESRPLMDSLPLAQMILFASIYGVDAEVAAKGMEPIDLAAMVFAEADPNG